LLNTSDGAKYSGKFTIGGKVVDGELTFNGPETEIYTHSPDFYYPDDEDFECVKGTLHDLTKVSLLRCVSLQSLGSSTGPAGKYHFDQSKPHVVVHGQRHIFPSEKIVDAIHFGTSDAPRIFYDFDAYGRAVAPTKAQIRSLVRAREKIVKRRITIGEHPKIAFFTGKREIFKAETIFGTVTATNNPRTNFIGTMGGVFIRNFVVIEINFYTRTSYDDAVRAMEVILRFLEVIAGRRQNIEDIMLKCGNNSKIPDNLYVYPCLDPMRKVRPGERSPQLADIPMNAVTEPENFASVLAEWLKRHAERAIARSRFSECFSAENHFTPDRIIGAANMFDLLPPDAVPATTQLEQEVIDARDACKKIFRALPDSPERQSILNALGRLGKSSLKRKVRHRAAPIIEKLGSRFPYLNEVLDKAVDCRNYFVHGGDTKIDYEKDFFAIVPFLTNALEFVFAASDLMEAGWDIVAWSKVPTTQSHPFGTFRVEYEAYLDAFNNALPEGKKIK